MDPFFEQRLRDEVIYLHSLWHQGPPVKPSSSTPFYYTPSYSHQIPTPNPKPKPTNNSLQPPNSTTFKKKLTGTSKKRPRAQRFQTTKKDSRSQLDPPQDSGPEWPCPEDPAPGPSSWAALKPLSSSRATQQPVSAEEQAQMASLQMQHKALEACYGFFNKPGEHSDGDDEDEDDDDDMSEDGSEENEEFKFFLRVFLKDSELRGYYEKNHESGEFCCLVCGGIGKKVWKRFKGCVGLVQHSISISKTKRKRAHRAFGQVVCKVLGWDIDRFPTIVLKGEPLGRSLAEPGELQNPLKKDNSSEQVEYSENRISSTGVNKEGVEDTPNALKEDNSSEQVENSEKRISSTGVNKEGVEDTLGSCSSSVSCIEWHHGSPIEEFPSAVSGWPSLNPQSASVTCSVLAKKEARSDAVQFQRKVLDACRKYFADNAGSDSDEDDRDLMAKDLSEECEEYKFFLKLFMEEGVFRSYYEDNHDGGEFCCLVCGGIEKKVWKRFKSCIALLQHSTTLSKTRKKRAHRAYGKVICKVLGWDIDQIPTIVFKGEPLRCSLEKSSELQGEPEGSADDPKDDSNVLEKNADFVSGDGEIVPKEDSDVHQNSCILMIH